MLFIFPTHTEDLKAGMQRTRGKNEKMSTQNTLGNEDETAMKHGYDAKQL